MLPRGIFKTRVRHLHSLTASTQLSNCRPGGYNERASYGSSCRPWCLRNELAARLLMRRVTSLRVSGDVLAALACFFVLVCLQFSIGAAAQAVSTQQDDLAPLPSEQIILLLQKNPDLLPDAKTMMANLLRSRGEPLVESQITNQRLYAQIGADAQLRLLLSNDLKRRGYTGEETDEQDVPVITRPQKMPSAGNAAGQAADSGKSAPRRESSGGKASLARQDYPYSNLPVLNELYTQSVADPARLERFGGALFRNSAITDAASLDIPVGPDYVLGVGDELVIEYWGSSSRRLRVVVDREGRVLVPEVGALMVAGLTLSQAQDLLQKAMGRQFRDVSVAVSLGRLKTVRAYVVGDVQNPGAYDISSLSTALSALLAAGGPTSTGSLRTVKHYRGKKLVEEVDLYELMLRGVRSDQERIESGDSILVPTTGPQVTVAGMVRRPAIYELRSEETLDQVLDLAGGVLVSGELGGIKVERIQAHERKVMLSVSLPPSSEPDPPEDAFKSFVVKDGDIVTVSPILPYSDKTLYLQGHVFRPGKYPYRDGIKVTDIIPSFADLLPEPADRAEIVRLRPPDYRPVVIGFDLREVLEKHAEAPGLQPFDTVRVFGRYEVDAPKASIFGEVLRPGEYPLSERMTAADLVRMAGGFKRSAYTESADLSSYAIVNGDHVELEHRQVPIGRALAGEPDTDVLLKAGDVLTISQLGSWADIGGAINLSGQVLHPGRYGIQEGEKLSSILKRAGGFLSDAYPYGAVLEREQVRQISSRSRDELIQKLETQNVSGQTSGKQDAAIAQQRQQLIDKLKQIEPSGRMVIHISSQIEKWENTAVDVEVRAGDKLVIPRQPNFVLIAGQVYNPTAITYSAGKHAGWYLRQAGGATPVGNTKEIFVVRANGAVVGRNSSQWWSGNVLSTVLEPGDTIFVPEKISSGDKLKVFAESAQVLSGLAVAARVAISF